jgi:hypothetical protein
MSFLKVDPNSAISFCMLCTSAFFYRKIFRLVGLGLTGYILIIGGDFNLPDICWSEQSIPNNQYPTHTKQTKLDTIADKGLERELWLGHFGWYSLVYNKICFCFK